MSVRVATNVAALFALHDLGRGYGHISNAATHLASGLRITRAADDAAGLSISHQLTTQINGLLQASSNVRDASLVAATADGALSSAQDAVQRMRQLVLRAANSGTASPEALSSIASEVGALTELLDAIADFTAAGGKRLLDGSYQATFQTGPGGGDNVILDLSRADLHAANLGGGMAGGGTNLRALSILDADNSDGIYNVNGVKGDLAALSESIVAITTARSTVGAVTNQLGYSAANLNAALAAVTASRSQLTDADMGTWVQKFATAQITTMAAASVVAQANSSPRAVLRLLRDSTVNRDQSGSRAHHGGHSESTRSARSHGGPGNPAGSSAPAPARGQEDSATATVRSKGEVAPNRRVAPAGGSAGSVGSAGSGGGTVAGSGGGAPIAEVDSAGGSSAGAEGGRSLGSGSPGSAAELSGTSTER